jgi:hypothetical protein
MRCKILFDVQELYYLPQYIPVYEELTRRGADCSFIFHQKPDDSFLLMDSSGSSPLAVTMKHGGDISAIYTAEKPDWVVFGNHNKYRDLLPKNTRTALLYHGIGIKKCYYSPSLASMSVRFVEGPYRLRELEKNFPSSNFCSVGFPKLDPLFSGKFSNSSSVNPTILYAPTFYPSSIEKMGRNWPGLLPDYQIIIKPHLFTTSRSAYKKQRQLIEHWAERYSHVQVVPATDSLVPHMAKADLLISEASSALFEFAATDKPVIWLDFFKLRWNYRGPLRSRFLRRMDHTILQYADIAMHVQKPADLPWAVRSELAAPDRLSSKRQEYTRELIGLTDGLASARAADYLLSN